LKTALCGDSEDDSPGIFARTTRFLRTTEPSRFSVVHAQFSRAKTHPGRNLDLSAEEGLPWSIKANILAGPEYTL